MKISLGQTTYLTRVPKFAAVQVQEIISSYLTKEGCYEDPDKSGNDCKLALGTILHPFKFPNIPSRTDVNGYTYPSTSWTYNSADLPVTMTYPDGETVTYAYNDRMLLNSVIGTSTYVSSTTYDAAGRIDLRAFGNNTQTDYVYFPWNTKGGRLQYLKSGTAGNPTSLQTLEYNYDSVGNVDWIKDWKAGSPQLQDLGYDSLDRLTSSVVTGGTGGLYNETYTYNSGTGNLASKAGLTYQYNDTAHKHAVTNAGSNTYQYDANGNMTQRVVGGQTLNFAYNAENRLVSVSGAATASFVYDGDGRRVKSTINGTTTTFAGVHYEVAGSTVTKYYFAGTQRVAMRVNGTLSYLLTDHLGSTALSVNTSGTLVSELRYKAWGEVRYSSGTMPTKYTYTGQYSNVGDFGLMFYNARWYDPALGRFASADTIIPGAGNSQAWDRYAYVNNAPTRYTDPTGHFGNCGDDWSDYRCKQHQATVSRLKAEWAQKPTVNVNTGINGCAVITLACVTGGSNGLFTFGSLGNGGLGSTMTIASSLPTPRSVSAPSPNLNPISTYCGDISSLACAAMFTQDLATLIDLVGVGLIEAPAVAAGCIEGGPLGCVIAEVGVWATWTTTLNNVETIASSASLGFTIADDLINNGGWGENSSTSLTTWALGLLPLTPSWDLAVDTYSSGYNHGVFNGVYTIWTDGLFK